MIEKYFLVPAVDPWHAHVVEIDDANLLSGIRDAIGCRYIEIAPMLPGFLSPPQGVCMVVDEEGWLLDNPVQNKLGTVLCGQPIAGNILFGRRGYRDGEPDLVGLEQSDIDFFTWHMAL